MNLDVFRMQLMQPAIHLKFWQLVAIVAVAKFELLAI